MNTVPKFAGTMSALRVAALAAIGLAIIPWTFAQTAPQANTQTPAATAAPAMTPVMTPVASSDTSAEEQVVHLNPFEVSTSRDVGYQATETLAGTRIRTNLADVSASISVVTKEFLDDIGAIDSSTLLNYTTNTQVAGPEGTYAGVGNGTSVDESGNLRSPAGAQRVRGLAAADNARDYFITDIPWDSFNVDRIDILRGPNSILYGLGSPAGIVNGTTRNAEFDNRGEVDGAHRLLGQRAGHPRHQPAAHRQRARDPGGRHVGRRRNTSSSRPFKTTSGSSPHYALTRSCSRISPSTPASR